MRLLLLRPDDLLTILKMALSIDLRDSGFPPPLYPSYEVLTFASVGLPPTEPISLSLSLDMPELNTHPAYPLSTLRCVPHGSSARLEAEWIATPFS